MELSWDILYRGPLDSCNYACSYCPFGKRADTLLQRDDDRRKLERFADWVAAQTDARVGVFFTPWGEALIHRHYQEAIVRLSHCDHVRVVSIQTNLSGALGWLARARRDRVALWTTWHPTQITSERFLAKSRELDRAEVDYSVGVVGLTEHLESLEALRAALPGSVYLWVNAYKDVPGYYDAETLRRITAVDPLFPINLRNHPSRGRACSAGETSFAVDGDGDAYRCHFVQTAIGNIYQSDFRQALQPRVCPKAHCKCHIGYVNLEYLRLREVYGDRLLARIPTASSDWKDWRMTD